MSRLGLNVHRDQWPTPAWLRGLEAAGFGWVQVHTPPWRSLLEREPALRHARALRAALDGTGLRLVLHGPDDLGAGTPETDRALRGLLEYAAAAGASHVVYHCLNFALDVDASRVAAEERALRQAAARAEGLGVTLALENLAPTWGGPSPADRLCHDPIAVRDLVRRLDSPAAGMLLDVGHAHLIASLRREDLVALARAVLADVVLFHVHDNLGARRHDLDAPGVDPLRLDLHLPPGAGTLPWDRVAPLLREHPAPLVLEVERSHVPDRAALRASAAGLLGRGALPTAA